VIVHHDTFAKNPDLHDGKYSSKLGIYKEHCGLDNILFSFGHDEYMYQLLKRNRCKLPSPAFAIIRLHSFYPWHTHGGYTYLCDTSDEEKLAWVRKFNECDLYSKSDLIKPDPVALRPYYDSLINKYFDSPYLEI
jgi:inositol oxygenase